MSHAKESSGSMVVKITKENFKKEILESKDPIVLDAFASWCIPCKSVGSILSELSQKLHGKVKFAKFDVEEVVALSKEFEIHAMPTLLFFKDGKVLGRHEGALSQNEILSVLNTLWSDLNLDSSLEE